MDGPVLFIKGWFFTLFFVYLYRRFWQTVGPRVPDFEAFCAKAPLLVAFSVAPGSEARLAEALRARLGKASEVVVTFGAWPWTYHALKLAVAAEPGCLRVSIVRCRVLRTRERPPSALTDALRAFALEHAAALRDSWLHPAALVPVAEVAETSGWRLDPSSNRRHGLSAWLVRPEWLDAPPSRPPFSAPESSLVSAPR
jgi:hypothetical protein